jgi:hypothetical protein
MATGRSLPIPPTILSTLDNAVIVDVDATAPIRQAEVGITKDMILRTRERFGLYPEAGGRHGLWLSAHAGVVG